MATKKKAKAKKLLDQSCNINKVKDRPHGRSEDMTQNIGFVSRGFSIHVSDRLVTQRVGNLRRDIDRNSNKTVFYRACDGHMILSYAGRAYLDNIPTDTFIAQSLCGMDFSKLGDFYMAQCREQLDIGIAVRRLRDDISSAIRRLPRSDQLEAFIHICISGWRERRRKPRIVPVVWEIKPRAGCGNDKLEIVQNPLSWNWCRKCTIQTAPDIDSSNELITSLFSDLSSRSRTLEEIGFVLVETIRKCSKARPDTVGRSCLVVTSTPFASPHLRIQYIPDDLHLNRQGCTENGYAPWIIDPPTIFAPFVIDGHGGGLTNVESGFAWTIQGLNPPPGVTHVSHSFQPRPHDPQKKVP